MKAMITQSTIKAKKPVVSLGPPARSNKGGIVRGQARAGQVKALRMGRKGSLPKKSPAFGGGIRSK